MTSMLAIQLLCLVADTFSKGACVIVPRAMQLKS